MKINSQPISKISTSSDVSKKFQKKSLKKLKSSRRENSEEEKAIDEKKLLLLNKLAQKKFETLGLDIESIKAPKRQNDEIEEIFQFIEQPESQSIIEDSEPFAETQTSRKAPEIVVFDSSKIAPIKGSVSKAGYKRFLSSSIKKLDSEFTPIIQTEEAKKEEDVNLKFDAELENLLSSSNLIERLAASELTGKERRKFQYQQLNKLGAKSMKQHQNPINVRFERINIKKRKTEEAIAKAKEEGNYHKSIKHLFDEQEKTKKKRSKDGNGLKTSLGKFNNGVLHISSSHIKRNANLSKKKS